MASRRGLSRQDRRKSGNTEATWAEGRKGILPWIFFSYHIFSGHFVIACLFDDYEACNSFFLGHFE